MIDFCILGSGVSGSTIANLLKKKYTVEVFDKARGPGGRASNKKFKNNFNFDHGAQYISPKTKEFEKFIKELTEKKILKKWKGNHLDLTFQKKDFKEKYIGKKSNNDICKHQLKKIKQNYLSHISNINKKKNYWEITLLNKTKLKSKGLIITFPYPQLIKIAKKYLNQKVLNLNVKMKPNITVMIAFKNSKNIPVSSIKFNDEILSWAANENSKGRFKSNTSLWTLQSSIGWALKNINLYKDNKKISKILQSRFLKLTGFDKKKIVSAKIHGWKYSYNFNSTNIDSYWDKKKAIGICADWFLGPKIENAWQSANSLSKKIKKNPLSNKRV